MSRMGSGGPQYVAPRSNVYTVLVAVALAVEVAGFVLLIMRAHTLFPAGGLFS